MTVIGSNLCADYFAFYYIAGNLSLNDYKTVFSLSFKMGLTRIAKYIKNIGTS